MRKPATVCAILLLGATVLSAQQKPDAKEQTKAVAKTAPAERAPEGQPINTRIDLTITDDRGAGQPIVKTVSVMTADRFWGRVRTQGEFRTPGMPPLPVILNVDARPTLLRENRARVEMTIEYRSTGTISGVFPQTPETTEPAARRPEETVPPNLNESLAVVLEDGKQTVISQSADPITDRKVKVEAKLTILR